MLTKREKVAGSWKQLHNEDTCVCLQKVKLKRCSDQIVSCLRVVNVYSDADILRSRWGQYVVSTWMCQVPQQPITWQNFTFNLHWWAISSHSATKTKFESAKHKSHKVDPMSLHDVMITSLQILSMSLLIYHCIISAIQINLKNCLNHK